MCCCVLYAMFIIFVNEQECGPIEEESIVMNVLDHAFDVLLVRFGIIKRVYTNVCYVN